VFLGVFAKHYNKVRAHYSVREQAHAVYYFVREKLFSEFVPDTLASLV